MGKGIGNAQTVVAHALVQLERALDAGHFEPGRVLPSERILARELRVNRTAIREAKATLLARGRLRLQGGRIFVTGATGATSPLVMPRSAFARCRQALEARRALWSQLARFAARRSTPRDGRRLQRAYSHYRLLRHAQPEELAHAYAALGAALGAASHNAVLSFLESQLQLWLRSPRELWYVIADTEHEQAHTRLIDGVVAHDAKAACRAIRVDLKEHDRRWLIVARPHLDRLEPPA